MLLYSAIIFRLFALGESTKQLAKLANCFFHIVFIIIHSFIRNSNACALSTINFHILYYACPKCEVNTHEI